MGVQEITQFLGGSDYKKTSDTYRDLSRTFYQLNSSALTIANKVYVSNRYSLQDTFTAAVRSYGGEVATLDFSKPASAAETINYWGHWKTSFNIKDTEDRDRHSIQNTVLRKPTMHLKDTLSYTESPELGARMVELPYLEKGFSMVIVLPDEVDGLASVIEKAQDRGFLTDLKLQSYHTDVVLDMPKFDVRSKLDLSEILPKVGVADLFSEPAPGIVQGRTVQVLAASQEAFIKVDEEGTTAAAFTGLDMAMPAPPSPLEIFRVDHPFLYLITYEDNILFAGTYTQ